MSMWIGLYKIFGEQLHSPADKPIHILHQLSKNQVGGSVRFGEFLKKDF